MRAAQLVHDGFDARLPDAHEILDTAPARMKRWR